MDSQDMRGTSHSFRYFDLSTSDPILPVKGQKFFFMTLFLFLMILFVRADTQISTDDFECNAFNCGTGWSGAWSYTGDCEITTLATPLDTYHMRGQSACDATRNFDDSIYSEVNVTFYATATSLEVGEYCRYYYYDGTTYHELLALTNGDDDGSHDYYNFNVTGYGLSSNAGIRMYGGVSSADYCYLDNVTIIGVVGVTLNLYIEDQYLTGTENVIIEADSSLTNTLHTFELAYPNGTIFCEANVTSPAVPSTVFSTTCDMPSTEHYNATATIYPTAQPEFNTTNYFDILQAQQDPNILNIQKVYFSPQVLQGGSTEIFSVITLGDNVTIDRIITTLTFPDGTNRVIGMEPTVNTGEYKAFITDTFQTNVTYFTIRVESGVYYDTYTNQYEVAAYTVDFVETVLRVDEILSQPPDLMVAGTDYFSGEYGKAFLQLIDAGLPVENATCRVTIYYPNMTVWVNDQAMIDAPNGLQYYPFVSPSQEGIYMITASCEYFKAMQWFYDFDDTDFPERAVIYGDWEGSDRNLNDYGDNLYVESNADQEVGSKPLYYIEANYTFNHTGSENITDMILHYAGESTKEVSLTFFWYNWSNSEFVSLPNSLTLAETIDPQAQEPTGKDQYISNDVPDEANQNGTVIIKVLGNHSTDFILLSNWLNIRGDELTGEAVNYLRGGGEIHISNKADIIVDLLTVINETVTETQDLIIDDIQVNVMGTDYEVGDNGRVWLQLVRNNTGFNDAICTVDIHKPSSISVDNQYFVEGGLLINLNDDGLYYYDFIVPNQTGVYMVSASCFIGQNTTLFEADYDNLIEGTVISGSINDINATDGVYYELREQVNGAGNRSYVHDFYFNLTTLPANATFTAIVFKGRLTPLNAETIKFQVYNWSNGQFDDFPNVIYAQDASTDIDVANTGDGSKLSDYINATGYARLRLQDTLQIGDISSNTLYIDRFVAGATYVVAQPVLGIQGGGELNIRDRWAFITDILIAINDTPTSLLLEQLIALSELVEDIEGVTDEQAFLITDSINSIQNMDSSSDVDEIKAYVKNNLEQFLELTKNVESPKKQDDYSMLIIVMITIVSILMLSNRGKVEEPKEEPFTLPNVRGKTIQTHAHQNMSNINKQEGGRN